MHVHDEVLNAAKRVGNQRGNWTFTPDEIVKLLPDLNQHTVRTHIGSRCCVNAPTNHPHKWDYFRRVERGRYEVLPKYRDTSASSKVALTSAAGSVISKNSQQREPRRPVRRDVIHAVIHAGQDAFTAECLEVAAVTQGSTLDEVVRNLNEVLALFLEGEDLAALGLSDHLRVQVIFEAPLSL